MITQTQQPLHGSPWVFNYLSCHQMITQTHPWGDTRVSEKVECSKFYCHIRQIHLAKNLPGAMNLQVADFAIIHQLPMAPIVTKLSPNNSPSGPGVVGGPLRITNFRPTCAGLKMVKSSPLGPGRGADLKNLEMASGNPSLVRGSIWKKKVERDWGLNRHTVAAISQPNFAHYSANKGAAWLPMGFYILPLSPNINPNVLEDRQSLPAKVHFSPNTCQPFLAEMVILCLSQGP